MGSVGLASLEKCDVMTAIIVVVDTQDHSRNAQHHHKIPIPITISRLLNILNSKLRTRQKILTKASTPSAMGYFLFLDFKRVIRLSFLSPSAIQRFTTEMTSGVFFSTMTGKSSRMSSLESPPDGTRCVMNVYIVAEEITSVVDEVQFVFKKIDDFGVLGFSV